MLFNQLKQELLLVFVLCEDAVVVLHEGHFPFRTVINHLHFSNILCSSLAIRTLSHSCGSDFRNSDGRCNISKNLREDEVTKLAIDLSPTSDISRLIRLRGFSEPTTSSALTLSIFSDKHASGSKNASEIIISLRYHRCLEKAVLAALDIDLSS